MTRPQNAGECRSCGVPIRWATTTANAKAIPLDPEPDPQGNVRLALDESGGGDDRAEVLGPLEAYAARASGESLWISHFATCPNRNRHRRQR